MLKSVLSFLSVSAVLLSFAAPAPVFASDDNTYPLKSQAGERSKETIRDLLLFWEEKDLFVQSATRHAKPVSQVAENITVITAKDIEDMNAHTVAEVLNRVTGVFVGFQGQGFGSASLVRIQSPDRPSNSERHVLVMLDGVAWNFLASGSAETNSIPVRIIKRIEVIKGPASSSWGSSLGGVVNIITKDAGATRRPSGSLSAAYGERTVQDYSAELAGKAGTVGYYVSAGRQDSDRLENRRYFENSDVYAKMSIPLSDAVKLRVSAGYSEPRIGFGIVSTNVEATGATYALFATAALDATLTSELKLFASLYTFKQKFDQTVNFMNPSTLYQNAVFDENSVSGTAKLVWTRGVHTAILGVDVSHGALDQENDAGAFLRARGIPAVSIFSPSIDKWAVFANDTIAMGKFSVTPGLRYDHNNVSGSFVSPSLGATYKLFEHTLLRASVARGFTTPPLGWTSTRGFTSDPNPSLKPEKVWSYQAGVETGITDYLWVRATAFRHDLRDLIVSERVSASRSSMFNRGAMRRQGVEFEAETAPVHNISLSAGYAFVRTDPPQSISSSDIYQYNLGLRYDDRKSFMADLFGHYAWLNLPASDQAKYSSFIWDLNLRKKVYSTGTTNTELFLTAHNLFSGSQYPGLPYINPQRWLEAGLRFKF